MKRASPYLHGPGFSLERVTQSIGVHGPAAGGKGEVKPKFSPERRKRLWYGIFHTSINKMHEEEGEIRIYILIFRETPPPSAHV